MAPHFDVNVIIVGQDTFTPAKVQQVNDAVGVMKVIFAALGPEVGTVRNFNIPSAAAGRLTVIRSHADAIALANGWSVKNDALDLFVVRLITGPTFVGLSPQPGDCRKNKTKAPALRAPVVTIQEEFTDQSGNTFAHEVGHFLGLPHCAVNPSLCAGAPSDFMDAVSASNTGVTAAQAALMKRHCLVRP
ncbi:hypothetical protein J5Y04_37230 [Kitasatospora sp. RG8]|uniref:hypothetical protein n=1 Tax=Kitasatospora sp. RG8 TaxID=2820815 RepID=UPI001AE019F4|nr:hypothetical protein [Kitasatospora sp. RG8]MBP0455120.1 hypothetical protein [Kitasatospora sp. RG8]